MPTEAMEKDQLHSTLDRIEAAEALKSLNASIDQAEKHLAGLRANIDDAAKRLEATQAGLAEAQKRRADVDHDADRVLHKAKRTATELVANARAGQEAALAAKHQNFRATAEALRAATTAAAGSS
jgi:F0F1-type ATP synthase membrane subunit b/b'